MPWHPGQSKKDVGTADQQGSSTKKQAKAGRTSRYKLLQRKSWVATFERGSPSCLLKPSHLCRQYLISAAELLSGPSICLCSYFQSLRWPPCLARMNAVVPYLISSCPTDCDPSPMQWKWSSLNGYLVMPCSQCFSIVPPSLLIKYKLLSTFYEKPCRTHPGLYFWPHQLLLFFPSWLWPPCLSRMNLSLHLEHRPSPGELQLSLQASI